MAQSGDVGDLAWLLGPSQEAVDDDRLMAARAAAEAWRVMRLWLAVSWQYGCWYMGVLKVINMYHQPAAEPSDEQVAVNQDHSESHHHVPEQTDAAEANIEAEDQAHSQATDADHPTTQTMAEQASDAGNSASGDEAEPEPEQSDEGCPSAVEDEAAPTVDPTASRDSPEQARDSDAAQQDADLQVQPSIAADIDDGASTADGTAAPEPADAGQDLETCAADEQDPDNQQAPSDAAGASHEPQHQEPIRETQPEQQLSQSGSDAEGEEGEPAPAGITAADDQAPPPSEHGAGEEQSEEAAGDEPTAQAVLVDSQSEPSCAAGAEEAAAELLAQHSSRDEPDEQADPAAFADVTSDEAGIRASGHRHSEDPGAPQAAQHELQAELVDIAGQPADGDVEQAPPDAGQPEAGDVEQAPPDAGQPEAGDVEQAPPDAGQPEAGDVEQAPPDASTEPVAEHNDTAEAAELVEQASEPGAGVQDDSAETEHAALDTSGVPDGNHQTGDTSTHDPSERTSPTDTESSRAEPQQETEHVPPATRDITSWASETHQPAAVEHHSSVETSERGEDAHTHAELPALDEPAAHDEPAADPDVGCPTAQHSQHMELGQQDEAAEPQAAPHPPASTTSSAGEQSDGGSTESDSETQSSDAGIDEPESEAALPSVGRDAPDQARDPASGETSAQASETDSGTDSGSEAASESDTGSEGEAEPAPPGSARSTDNQGANQEAEIDTHEEAVDHKLTPVVSEPLPSTIEAGQHAALQSSAAAAGGLDDDEASEANESEDESEHESEDGSGDGSGDGSEDGGGNESDAHSRTSRAAGIDEGGYDSDVPAVPLAASPVAASPHDTQHSTADSTPDEARSEPLQLASSHGSVTPESSADGHGSVTQESSADGDGSVTPESSAGSAGQCAPAAHEDDGMSQYQESSWGFDTSDSEEDDDGAGAGDEEGGCASDQHQHDDSLTTSPPPAPPQATTSSAAAKPAARQAASESVPSREQLLKQRRHRVPLLPRSPQPTHHPAQAPAVEVDGPPLMAAAHGQVDDISTVLQRVQRHLAQQIRALSSMLTGYQSPITWSLFHDLMEQQDVALSAAHWTDLKSLGVLLVRTLPKKTPKTVCVDYDKLLDKVGPDMPECLKRTPHTSKRQHSREVAQNISKLQTRFLDHLVQLAHQPNTQDLIRQRFADDDIAWELATDEAASLAALGLLSAKAMPLPHWLVPHHGRLPWRQLQQVLDSSGRVLEPPLNDEDWLDLAAAGVITSSPINTFVNWHQFCALISVNGPDVSTQLMSSRRQRSVQPIANLLRPTLRALCKQIQPDTETMYWAHFSKQLTRFACRLRAHDWLRLAPFLSIAPDKDMHSSYMTVVHYRALVACLLPEPAPAVQPCPVKQPSVAAPAAPSETPDAGTPTDSLQQCPTGFKMIPAGPASPGKAGHDWISYKTSTPPVGPLKARVAAAIGVYSSALRKPCLSAASSAMSPIGSRYPVTDKRKPLPDPGLQINSELGTLLNEVHGRSNKRDWDQLLGRFSRAMDRVYSAHKVALSPAKPRTPAANTARPVAAGPDSPTTINTSHYEADGSSSLGPQPIVCPSLLGNDMQSPAGATGISVQRSFVEAKETSKRVFKDLQTAYHSDSVPIQFNDVFGPTRGGRPLTSPLSTNLGLL